MTCRTAGTGQPRPRSGARVLIYSHDSFGLGHLRRCRTIAQALVAGRADVSVLILSGSPIIGNFDFPAGVDFVRVPGVIKLSDGDYRSLSLDLALEETLALRASIIEHTAEAFAPDIFIVDKEPLGLRGEIEGTLETLKARGTTCILGLRDVLDGPELLRPEWMRKKAMPALDRLYDEIWVYGVRAFWDPLTGLGVPETVRDKMVYTGYLRRELPDYRDPEFANPFGRRPYLLVTGGGGGDSVPMVDRVLAAYQSDNPPKVPALIALGPFMPTEDAARFIEWADRRDDIACLTFNSHIERLVARAAGVVAMGGYNTFCEILSFDRPAILIPRTRPRREQEIRAERAQALGLVRMVNDAEARDPALMAAALDALPEQPRPSSILVPGLLDGLPTIVDRVNAMLDAGGAVSRALP